MNDQLLFLACDNTVEDEMLVWLVELLGVETIDDTILWVFCDVGDDLVVIGEWTLPCDDCDNGVAEEAEAAVVVVADAGACGCDALIPV